MKKDRLGRGLGALLGEYAADRPPEGGSTRALPIAAIAPNPFQPRREFSEQELADLVASIRENGLLQPIVVRPAPAGSATEWELVAGERRWRATTRLGWKEIPALVRDVDDRTLLVLALVENLQRAELSTLEEAEGFRRLGEEFQLNHQQIADVVGRDRSTIANSLRLLQLPPSVRQMLAEGKLTAGHGRALLGLGNDRKIADLARAAVENGWSVRDVEAQVQRVRPEKRKARNEKPRDPAERALEDELQVALDVAVKIRRSRGSSGKIEIPFRGHEEFERLFERLAGRPAGDIVS
jgi:ParB family transcriptional regulator, chromosome partitioning protein